MEDGKLPAETRVVRDEKGLFQPGTRMGGRPKGSRNKLGEEFLSQLHADFVEHGAKVIQTVRTEKPDVYLKVVASILPTQMEVKIDPIEEMSDADLDRYIKQLAAAVARFDQLEDAAGAGAESEARPLSH